MVERHDHKREDVIIDGLGADIRGLPVFLQTEYIIHAHMEMKAQMHLWTGKYMHT